MKLGMATAALYSRPKPSMLTHRVPLHHIRQKPLTEPVRVETAGYRWLAVLTAASCERRVADELSELGFKAYCPLGRKLVSWQGGRQLKTKLVREYPVFSRYIFVGIPAEREVMSVARAEPNRPFDTPPPSMLFIGGGALTPEIADWINQNWGAPKIERAITELSKGMSDKIVSILGDASGPIIIPPAAINRVNALELAGEWDGATYKPERSPYRQGVSVNISKGPYAAFPATVDGQESESRLRVLVTMFGRQNAVSVDVDEVELVA